MNLGKVYTRRIVADFMVSLFSAKVRKILDPCFGGGVFVDSILETTSDDVIAIEIDTKSYHEYSNRVPERCQLINDNFFNLDFTDADGIVMNPPYVRQEEIDEMLSLGVSKEIIRRACRPLSIPAKSNLYVYFILKAALLLSDGGELVAIFPDTWKLTPDGKRFEEILCGMGSIESYIHVDGVPFEGSPLVDVCIVKFVKGSRNATQYYDITVNDTTIEAYGKDKSASLENCELPLLSSVAFIRRGVTTGANKMFINPSLLDDTHIHKILSSPKNIKGYSTQSCVQDKILAIGTEEKISDEESGYLSECAAHILKEGKPVTLRNLIEQDKVWYTIKLPTAPHLVFSYIIRDNMKFIFNDGGCVVRDNFYSVYSNVCPYLMFALLNNYYTYFQLETIGKKYGNGMLKIQAYDLNAIHIPDISLIGIDDSAILENLSKELIVSSDKKYIDKITRVLSKYYPLGNPKEKYYGLKAKRLQKS